MPSMEEIKPYIMYAARDIWQNGNGSAVLFTFINDAYEKLLNNWLCNTLVFEDLHKQLIIVPFSQSTCDNIKDMWGDDIKCLALKFNGYSMDYEVGSQRFMHILHMRAELLQALTQFDIPFLLFDVDSVWFEDPRSRIANLTEDESINLIAMKKIYFREDDNEQRNNTLSVAPMFVNPTSISKEFFKDFVERMRNSRDAYDEDVLNEMCQEKSNGMECKSFSSSEFADGGWFKLSPNEKRATHPISAHNNAYDQAKNKEARQNLNGLWFLSKKGQHCVLSKTKKTLKTYFDPPKT